MKWRYEIDRDAIAKAARISHLMPEDSDIDEAEWLRAAAANPALDLLKDPEEGIYTLSGGMPFNDAVQSSSDAFSILRSWETNVRSTPPHRK